MLSHFTYENYNLEMTKYYDMNKFLLFINVDLGYSSFSILIQLLQERLKNPHNLKTKHHFLAALKLRNNDCVPIHLLICLKGTSCFWSIKTIITTFSPNSEMVSCNPNPLNFFLW